MNRIELRSAADMEAEARAWTRDDLLRLWRRIKAGETIPGWPVGRAFDLEGASVIWPFQVIYPQRFGTMEQVDGVVYLGERAFLLESKQRSEPSAVGDVARLRMRLESRPPGTMGVLFSARDFTLPTEILTQFATPLNILLWASEDLDLALAEGSMVEGLQDKLAHATESGLSNLSLKPRR